MSIVIMPAAKRYYDDLVSDTRRRPLARALVQAVMGLDADKGTGEFRRRRYQARAVFGFLVRGGDDEVLVLWQPHPTVPEDVVIRYIGPDI